VCKNNKAYVITPKHKRKTIYPLYKKNNDNKEEYLIIPKRVIAITESQKNANYEFKSHEKVALNKNLYTKVMKFFFKRLVYYLIKTGYKIIIPYVKLGSLQVCQIKKPNSVRKRYVNFAESKKQNKTIYDYPKHWLNGFKPFLNHTKEIRQNNRNVRIDNTKHSNYYSWQFIRTVYRKNTYNKDNHELTLVNHFNTEGYKMYHKLT
jgi:hypothetical protein